LARQLSGAHRSFIVASTSALPLVRQQISSQGAAYTRHFSGKASTFHP
jgi:hypothetical protein